MRRKLWTLAAAVLLYIGDVCCRLGIVCEWKAEAYESEEDR